MAGKKKYKKYKRKVTNFVQASENFAIIDTHFTKLKKWGDRVKMRLSGGVAIPPPPPPPWP